VRRIPLFVTFGTHSIRQTIINRNLPKSHRKLHSLRWKVGLRILIQLERLRTFSLSPHHLSSTATEVENSLRVYSVVLVDELDQMLSKRQEVLYNFFNWPHSAHSRLVVIAVANTMDLPEREMSGKIRSRLGELFSLSILDTSTLSLSLFETDVRSRMVYRNESYSLPTLQLERIETNPRSPFITRHILRLFNSRPIIRRHSFTKDRKVSRWDLWRRS